MKKKLNLLAAAAAATALLAGPAFAGGYLKVGDIKGESTDSNHDKWVDVLSVDWGAHKPGGGASAEPGGTAVFTVKEDDNAVLIGLLLPAVQKVRDAAARSGSSRANVRSLAAPTTGQAGRMTFEEEGGGLWTLHDVTYNKPKAAGRAGATHEIIVNYACADWVLDRGESGSTCAQKGKVDASWKVEEGEK